MAIADDKPPLLVLPGEAELHQVLFEATPLRIIECYLKCFDSEGRQAFQVPTYILEAMASRFLRLTYGELNSLDEAFGGRIARQRNRLLEEEKDWGVLFEFLSQYERVKSEPLKERGAGSPYDLAAERTAEELGMRADNVRRIYKKAAKQ